MENYDNMDGRQEDEHGEHYQWNFTRCFTWSTIFACIVAFIVWILTLIF